MNGLALTAVIRDYLAPSRPLPLVLAAASPREILSLVPVSRHRCPLRAGTWLAIAMLAGCRVASLPAETGLADGQQALGPPPESTLVVPVAHADWTWEQIVDVVDDYFDIERERQVHLADQAASEGRIDTFAQVGATAVEPHRLDSVGSYNCWEATLQTIRRRAELRVIPQGATYLIIATVYKQLEDLPRPEHATAGSATFRNDASLPSHGDEDVSRTRLSAHWIDLGRDVALERQILADVQARLGAVQ
ncbi:MAG: hypothetical protein KDA61_04300 [Planctomycetales bacterium]|nr:hypothetical protein [Planctomycetales bacterium]